MVAKTEYKPLPITRLADGAGYHQPTYFSPSRSGLIPRRLKS